MPSTTRPSRPRTEHLDVRDLPPPQPLQETPEIATGPGDDVVLIQVNDREPQHL